MGSVNAHASEADQALLFRLAEKFQRSTIPKNHTDMRKLCLAADAMLQQILTRPKEYSVVATLNLNGDYLSDALAAQVGGIGIAPGANLSDTIALFEATHGTAPKYAGLDKVNPSSLILSGVEMLKFMGWTEAAELIASAVTKTITQGIVTYDLARQMEGAQEVRCSEFGAAIRENIEKAGVNH